VSAVSNIAYVGSELELFAKAANWKRYFASRICPHLGEQVLEVGAGLGATAQVLCKGEHQRWVCLEPDPQMAALLQSAVAGGQLPGCCRAHAGALADLDAADLFDSILYIDVLEHIPDHRAEVERATAHLRPGGKLIVLSPAHQWLFTPFDQAIGHQRRYTKKTLAAVVPASLRCVRLLYLDAVGMFASLGNRLVLSQRMPTSRQLWIWDKLMVPLSRIVDPLLFHTTGRSVLGIWQNPEKAA
jgi:SAM-dependent methyltransferase